MWVMRTRYGKPRHEGGKLAGSPSSGKTGKLEGSVAVGNMGRSGDAEGGLRPITNQESINFAYGASNISKTGCVPIAIYNVLLLKKKPATLERIVMDVRSAGAPLVGGHMGTDPYMMKNLLKKYGIESEEITDKVRLNSMMEEESHGAVYVITQWNNARRPAAGVHAFVAEKRSNFWALYNKYYRMHATKASDLTEILDNGRLIVAYKIQ